MLKRIQEPEAWEPQINQAAFEALDMAIEALDCSESPNSSDTISRQAAIDAICRDGVRLERGGALMITISTAKQWAVDLLCDLPSAQLEEMREAGISRYGVAAWLDNMGYTKLAYAVMDKDRFPSVHPEKRTDKHTKMHACDLIDRQAAIDAIRASTSKYTGFMEMEMYTDDDAVEAIEDLPSAQPVITCDGCKFVGTYDTDFPCRNCIRREKDYYAQE